MLTKFFTYVDSEKKKKEVVWFWLKIEYCLIEYFYYYKMTEVITEIPTIKLIPIFTSAEEKLQANLDMIIRKLQYHDKLISSNRNMIQ